MFFPFVVTEISKLPSPELLASTINSIGFPTQPKEVDVTTTLDESYVLTTNGEALIDRFACSMVITCVPTSIGVNSHIADSL